MPPSSTGQWKRIVLKLSGEAFASNAVDETIDTAVVDRLAGEISEVRRELGTEVAVVVGGGNIWATPFSRPTRPPRCGPSKSKRTSYSRAPTAASMVSTAAILDSTPPR